MKCSKHQDKDAVAMCDKCNLFYCGDCTLSSNGRCPSCGRALRSPEVVPVDMSPEDLYRHQGQIGIYQAINSIYIEPVRTIRRIKENASIVTGALNVALVFIILLVARTIAMFALLVFVAQFAPGGGLDTISGVMSAFLKPTVLVLFVVESFYEFGVWVILWLVLSLILHAPAKLLGGKGTYTQQACLISYAMLATLPPFIFSSAMVVLPYNIGVVVAFLGNVATLVYAVFLTALIIKEINKFGKFAAVVSFLASFFIIVVLAVIGLSILFFQTIAAAVGKSLPLSI